MEYSSDKSCLSAFERWSSLQHRLSLFINHGNELARLLEDLSLLELIFREDTVLLGVLVVDLSLDLRLSELVLGLGFLLGISTTLSMLDVLESLSETILDRKDLSGSLVQKVINLRLDLGIGLVIIFLKFDLRDSKLNLSDELTESLFSGFFSVITLDSFRSFLDLLLLVVSSNLLVGNFFTLLLVSHLINFSCHFL